MRHFILLSAIAVFTIIAIPSCTCIKKCMDSNANSNNINEFQEVNIITKDKNSSLKKIKVEPPWVVLQFGTNQQVKWIIDDSKVKFTIKFRNHNPFENTNINNGHNKSGKVKIDPGEVENFYYYSVDIDRLGAIDPGIIIWKKN